MIGDLTTGTDIINPQASARVRRLAAGHHKVARIIDRAVAVSIEGLQKMFRAGDRLFAFTRRREGHGGLRLQGFSVRYSAIAALGGLRLPEALQRRVFGGETAGEYVARLVAGLDCVTDLGDTALVCWAAAESRGQDREHALGYLRQRAAGSRRPLTVEVAWTLAALSACCDDCRVRTFAVATAERVLGAFKHEGGLFPHYLGSDSGPWYRRHVGSFADQIYPIQALARYHSATGDSRALRAATRCAEQMCDRQGKDGQWWWHYDVRTGGVIEGYPVYSVHQDAMAPMALMDLHEAGGPDHSEAIRRGVRWLDAPAEVRHSLIDEESAVIWRKVARTEPRKAVRSVRALASRVHTGLRIGWLDRLCPATSVDYECRPYHLGWILYAWLGGK